TRRAREHRSRGHACLAPLVGPAAREHASNGAAGNGDEGDERTSARCGARTERRRSTSAERRRSKCCNPGPHRIELPHVTEIAERREADAAVLQHHSKRMTIERG